jgi:hypothetical protein
MRPVSGPAAGAAADAAGRTAAAGSARLLAAWCTGSPLPEAADRRCEGVADLAARRARVSQSMFFTDRLAGALAEAGAGTAGLLEGIEHSEMIYDGANAYVRAAAGRASPWLILVACAGRMTRLAEEEHPGRDA